MKQDEHTHIYFYKNHKPAMLKWLSYLVLFVSLLRIVDTPIFSILLGLASSGILIYKRGIEVNFNTKQYRYFTTFGPQVLGAWVPLPDLKYLSVFKTQLVGKIYGRSGTAVSQQVALTEVNLVAQNNKIITVYVANTTEEAFEQAQHIAQQLGLRIWDATTREGKFVTE